MAVINLDLDGVFTMLYVLMIGAARRSQAISQLTHPAAAAAASSATSACNVTYL